MQLKSFRNKCSDLIFSLQKVEIYHKCQAQPESKGNSFLILYKSQFPTNYQYQSLISLMGFRAISKTVIFLQ